MDGERPIGIDGGVADPETSGLDLYGFAEGGSGDNTIGRTAEAAGIKIEPGLGMGEGDSAMAGSLGGSWGALNGLDGACACACTCACAVCASSQAEM